MVKPYTEETELEEIECAHFAFTFTVHNSRRKGSNERDGWE